jgi:hypothetical protein
MTASCSASSDAEQQRETVQSWIATVRLARQAYDARAVSQTYLAQLRDGAVSALAEARATLAAAHDVEHERVATDSLATAILEVNRALERR